MMFDEIEKKAFQTITLIKSHSNIVQKISIFSNRLTHDFDYKIEISSDFVSLWKGLRYDDWRSAT